LKEGAHGTLVSRHRAEVRIGGGDHQFFGHGEDLLRPETISGVFKMFTGFFIDHQLVDRLFSAQSILFPP
jgi:hypothetical protein